MSVIRPIPIGTTIWPGSLGDIKSARARLGDSDSAFKIVKERRAAFGEGDSWRRQGSDDLLGLALEAANAQASSLQVQMAQ